MLKLAKNQANAKQQPETKFCHLKIIHILHAGYHPKITIHILKKKKNQVCLIHETLQLIKVKMIRDHTDTT